MGEHYYRYSTEPSEDFDHAQSFKSIWDEEHGDWLATEAAEHFHDQADGWESSWDNGIDFQIWREDGRLLGTWNVIREYSPSFTAFAKEPT